MASFEKLNTRQKEAADTLIKALQEELIAQGHVNTQDLLNSFEARVGDITLIEILANDYALSLNDGVKPGRIPYTPGGGRGGKSKFIQGLMNYIRTKGIASGVSEVRAAAFAMATVMSREGMPTNASRKFSKNGKRTGFIDDAIEKAGEQLASDIGEGAKEEIELELEKVVITAKAR